MCNPPFYESKVDMLTSAASKQRPPFTACTGSETEMVTPGGEVAFVSRMIEDSLRLQDRVQWYTSMLGKFSSVSVIVEKLRENGINNYAVTQFVQGSKTRRWGIAWSHDDLRPRMDVARGVGSLPKGVLPFPSEYTITVLYIPLSTFQTSNAPQVNGPKISNLVAGLNAIISHLPLKWMWKPSISTGIGFCERDVWSRAARRQAASKGQEMEFDEDADMALGFKITVEKSGEAGAKVTIRWLKGHDSVLFESFCGMVKRRFEEAVK
jgi:23S rRNA (adenine1618-N6)-methyltransferase